MCRQLTIAILSWTLSSSVLLAAQSPASPSAEELVKQGRAFVSQGKYQEAVTLYRQALKLSPQLFDARLAMGMVLDLSGQYAEARTHLAEAIKRAPLGAARNQAMNAMAISWAFEQRADEAVKYLEPVYQQQLTDRDLAGAAATSNAVGRLFLETGNIAGARQWYERGIRHARAIADLAAAERDLWELRWLHAAARLAVREGRVEDARKQVAAFEQTMQKRGRPNDDGDIYRYLLGYISFHTKDYDRAIAELAKANLNDPFITSLLAMAYEAKGDAANARQYYRRTLDINAHSLPNALVRTRARSKLTG